MFTIALFFFILASVGRVQKGFFKWQSPFRKSKLAKEKRQTIITIQWY